jgi:hypothetical protein
MLYISLKHTHTKYIDSHLEYTFIKCSENVLVTFRQFTQEIFHVEIFFAAVFSLSPVSLFFLIFHYCRSDRLT